MSGCTAEPQAKKACSGKCTASGCAESSDVWVLAACEGAGVLFRRDAGDSLVPLAQASGQFFSQHISDVALHLNECLKRQKYAQLIVVGSPVDIAWVHSSLSAPVAQSIIAEVRYPLLLSWFNDPLGFSQLKHALNGVVHL